MNNDWYGGRRPFGSYQETALEEINAISSNAISGLTSELPAIPTISKQHAACRYWSASSHGAGVPGRLSKLAMFDARLYIRKCLIDQTA
jgi:hypothetical protein